jgi:predicted SprT family Zn-dependent metalloprotease
MKNSEIILRRREAEVKAGQDALAHALTKTLVLLPHKGNCKCGMMLTEQDRNKNTETYRCPRCGKSGPLTLLAAVSPKKGYQEKS